MNVKVASNPRATSRKLRTVGIGLILLLVLGIIGFNIAQRQSDGPLNDMIPGGALVSGELVTAPVEDWQFMHGKTIELQLLNPSKSRYTGAMTLNNQLYIPCDLGYVWGRLSGTTRHILHLIYVFKRWHEDALQDGRVVLRLDDKRYARQAVRVTDPATIKTLKTRLESMARDWMAPDILGPAPTSGPRDIWFFRLDPRAL